MVQPTLQDLLAIWGGISATILAMSGTLHAVRVMKDDATSLLFKKNLTA